MTLIFRPANVGHTANEDNMKHTRRRECAEGDCPICEEKMPKKAPKSEGQKGGK